MFASGDGAFSENPGGKAPSFPIIDIFREPDVEIKFTVVDLTLTWVIHLIRSGLQTGAYGCLNLLFVALEFVRFYIFRGPQQRTAQLVRALISAPVNHDLR
jgi:hypothetical protein